ncbi:MAG: hypothetical protein P8X42_08515 [Calditrichaceae bacterium]|jgi:hypothetical protein
MKTIFIFLFFTINILIAQINSFDEKAFFTEMKNSYYTLNSTGLHNFSALVTSLKMQKFAKEQWDNEEIFPLQLIWFKPDKIYLSQQGIPTIKEGKYKEYQDLISGIKLQIRGILENLQRFYFTGIFESIPNDYSLNLKDNFVLITAEADTQQSNVKTVYTMGRNGLCLKIEIDYPADNQKIIITPSFKINKTKWLCNGWTVQTLINEEITNGYVLQIKYGEYQSIWLPTEIIISVQKADEPGNTFYDMIIFRNYLFNQNIKLQEGGN